jgi:hypothetical protein
MNIGRLTFGACVLAITATWSMAQSYTLDKVPPPMNANDAFVLQLPHPVVVGRRVLQPGRYTCQQLYIAGSDLPVLTIRGDDGVNVNIAATISPTFTAFAPADTQATYYHIGNNYYFNRIWVQGLNYGYKFRLPKNLRRQAAE